MLGPPGAGLLGRARRRSGAAPPRTAGRARASRRRSGRTARARPRSRTASMNSIASRVLPIPGSPSSSTSWRLPSVARSRYSRRRSSSPRRPTNAAPLRVAKKPRPSVCSAARARRRRPAAGAGAASERSAFSSRSNSACTCGPGDDAELVAQQRAQPLVHAQRLDEVALRLAHAHQQQVAALAVAARAPPAPAPRARRAPARRRRPPGPRRRAARAPAARAPRAGAAGPRARAPRSRAAGRRRPARPPGRPPRSRPASRRGRAPRTPRRARAARRRGPRCAAGVSCTARSPAFSITSGPSARRSFDSTTLSACAWPAGASSPHSAAIRRSRVTPPLRLSARWASARRP